MAYAIKKPFSLFRVVSILCHQLSCINHLDSNVTVCFIEYGYVILRFTSYVFKINQQYTYLVYSRKQLHVHRMYTSLG